MNAYRAIQAESMQSVCVVFGNLYSVFFSTLSVFVFQPRRGLVYKHLLFEPTNRECTEFSRKHLDQNRRKPVFLFFYSSKKEKFFRKIANDLNTLEFHVNEK